MAASQISSVCSGFAVQYNFNNESINPSSVLWVCCVHVSNSTILLSRAAGGGGGV